MTFQTFTPIEYLKIDIASNFGLDKETWDFRINWFNDNEENLDGIIKDADEPALFYAGTQAYYKALRGEASGYPISLDATASGAQLLSVMVGCAKSARLCNVIDTGDREDLYTNIFDVIATKVSSVLAVSQKQAKQAIMTWLYGSMAQPKSIFGEGEDLGVFLETMHTEAPGISQLNEALLSLWQPKALSNEWVLPDNFHVKVKVMNEVKHHATFLNRQYISVTQENMPNDFGLSLPANTTHSVDGLVVREMQRRCDYDSKQRVEVMELCLNSSMHSAEKSFKPSSDSKMTSTLIQHYRDTNFMSVRILDHINQDTIQILSQDERTALLDILLSMPDKPFKVLTIHDCFRVLPNHGNDLRWQYNNILSQIADSSILTSIASQICHEKVNVEKFDDIAGQVLEANYALS
jgi:ACT domain-containing protein